MANWSKDPNTKVGAIAVDSSRGKTSMPREQFEVAKTMFKESGVDLEMGHVLE